MSKETLALANFAFTFATMHSTKPTSPHQSVLTTEDIRQRQENGLMYDRCKTKYVELVAIKDKEDETTGEAIFNKWI